MARLLIISLLRIHLAINGLIIRMGVTPPESTTSLYVLSSGKQSLENDVCQDVKQRLWLRMLAEQSCNSPELQLQQYTENGELQVFKITAQGMVGSLRNRKDGRVYFGSCEQSCDSLLGKDNFEPVAFSIAFDPLRGNYLLQGGGSLFIKKKIVLIYSGLRLRVGSSELLVRSKDGVYEIVRNDPESVFEVLQPLTIGRDPVCDIQLRDQTVSRLHATVEKVLDWSVIDYSKFGTWATSDGPERIEEGLEWKVGSWKFKAKIVQKK